MGDVLSMPAQGQGAYYIGLEFADDSVVDRNVLLLSLSRWSWGDVSEVGVRHRIGVASRHHYKCGICLRPGLIWLISLL